MGDSLVRANFERSRPIPASPVPSKAAVWPLSDTQGMANPGQGPSPGQQKEKIAPTCVARLRRCSLGRLRGQTDFGDIQLLEHVEHAHHVLIFDFIGAFHNDDGVGSLRLDLLKLALELRHRYGLII